jgi:hypothetical protein
MGLEEQLPNANNWCNEMGAAVLEEVFEDMEGFSEALDLLDHEAETLAARWKTAYSVLERTGELPTQKAVHFNTDYSDIQEQVGFHGRMLKREGRSTRAAAEPVKAAKTAASGNARAALDQAKDALKAAETDLEAAQTAAKEANKGVHKADAFLRGIWEDMRKVCDAQDGLAGDLKHFKEDVWSAFNQLKEKEPDPEPVPEPEVAAEPEPAAAEPVAAES